MSNFNKLAKQIESDGFINFGKLPIDKACIVYNIISQTYLEKLSKQDWQEIVIDMVRDGGTYFVQ